MSELPPERIVADHLERTSMSLQDALVELNMDVALADDNDFCTNLDFHILLCLDCHYWFLPCEITEDHKGEHICYECAELSMTSP